MRIAQIAPLFESVPPVRYGGTERVVYYLTEELVARGHEVTLFASGDSRTSAELYECVPKGLRLGVEYTDATIYETAQLECVFRIRHRFDILHFHTGHIHYPTSTRLGVPNVTTLHGRLDMPELRPLYRLFKDVPLVSISDAQRTPIPSANWQATVYHGLPLDMYTFNAKPKDYLTFVGRISPEKRVDRAIEIAMTTGIPLRIGAKVDNVDKEYYDAKIKPLIKGNKLVDFVGEVNDEGKQELIGNAKGLLFPIDWPEPFGLVMIEAMACGTPVIAWRRGSIPEVMREGVSGFVVDSMDQAIRAVERVDAIDRAGVRAFFEKRYSAGRMADDYERVYRRLIMACRIPARLRSRSLIGA